ncbi:MAG: DNA helicase PcrA [Clostridia bacterium]|nr:DNA helicase PcrA [Clostridia bacterium]
MSDLLNGLNDRQKEAVEYLDGPLLILAGAGSGKTRVLTYKIAYLLEKKIVKPWEILAITFTNKAAKEMKERVEGLVGAEAQDMWLGTFHSVCVRILKREIELLGYSRDFNIFDEIDKDKVIKEVMKKLNIDDKIYPTGLIKAEISKAKEVMKDDKQYAKDAQGDFRKEEIAKVYTMYQQTLRTNNSIDFDDIIMLTVQLFLEHPDRLAYYQEKYKYVLVDEYQDTNKTQFLLISLLTAGTGNICVVGDESQSIYGFRGADITNILNFEKEFPSAKIIKLEENYRSTKNILNAANEVIKNNSSKIDKVLWTQNKEGEKINYKTLNNEYEEVEYVVETIDDLCRKENKKYSDFAVLFRTNAQARVLEEVFMRTGTPYKLIGGIKFYARKEIKDIISYLKLINNKNDNIALKRIINEPKRGIGDTALDKLDNMAQEKGMSIFELIQDNMNLAGLRSAGNIILFRDMMNDLMANKETFKVSDLIKRVLKISGYEDMLNAEGTKETEIRFENLMEFIGVAIEFENENAENTLEDFLDSIALVSDVDNLDESTEAVTLMTMHSAKGLEFDDVFLVGMEEGLFPSKRSIEEDASTEEERRLCYVAITRAKDQLFLTNTKKRTLYGSTSFSLPSRFIDEIPDNLLTEDSVENKESRGIRRQSSFLDDEYKRVETYLSNRDRVQTTRGTMKPQNKPKVGISVESFLKNLGGATAAPQKQMQPGEMKYKVGMEVKHKKFGVGTIQNIEPEGDDFKLEIMFENSGFKRLMANFTPLEIIE